MRTFSSKHHGFRKPLLGSLYNEVMMENHIWSSMRESTYRKKRKNKIVLNLFLHICNFLNKHIYLDLFINNTNFNYRFSKILMNRSPG